MEDWQRYATGGIFDMTEEDLKALIKFSRKGKNLETLLYMEVTLDDENGEADGGDELEEENDDSVKTIYLSCLTDLTRDEHTGVVGNRGREGKTVEQASDQVHTYSGDHDSEKKSELKRLNALFSMYKQKKEDIRKKRLNRKHSAHKFNNDCESHPNIPNEDNYMDMKDVTVEVSKILDNLDKIFTKCSSPREITHMLQNGTELYEHDVTEYSSLHKKENFPFLTFDVPIMMQSLIKNPKISHPRGCIIAATNKSIVKIA
ncbi:hypothetical protein AK88_05141 [Plasmodium fragile]|uniref:Uncharacterized protein n=1 Tax=Plasmodium fragile TaxID=5857 RepID=A0A0D9QE17_PLAFR|nr:uncharacterized protein AK88_05141 [Plasmodium fragile]KJP85214.1 hypothetical protein AK88_05141 [Plasmodium fragile]